MLFRSAVPGPVHVELLAWSPLPAKEAPACGVGEQLVLAGKYASEEADWRRSRNPSAALVAELAGWVVPKQMVSARWGNWARSSDHAEIASRLRLRRASAARATLLSCGQLCENPAGFRAPPVPPDDEFRLRDEISLRAWRDEC